MISVDEVMIRINDTVIRRPVIPAVVVSISVIVFFFWGERKIIKWFYRTNE